VGAARGWLAVAALSLLGASYSNEEFGLKVELPPGASTCRALPPEHDHGINVYLDGAGDGCDRLEQRPHMGVGGEYNAAEDPSPRAVIADLCSSNGVKEVTAPTGLALPGRRTAVCRGDSPDTAWVDVWVATQAGQSGGAEVNYTANLHTIVSRFDKDLAVFREFLARRVTLQLPPAVAVDGEEPCADALTTIEMTSCEEKELAAQDAALAERIAALNGRLSKEEKARFEKSQAAWLRYRELECEANGVLYSGSALQPVQALRCKAFLTEERTREVLRILQLGAR
jgi:uncharacterized protein YecT (DUF1311 family)